jgi:hypothetical protein
MLPEPASRSRSDAALPGAFSARTCSISACVKPARRRPTVVVATSGSADAIFEITSALACGLTYRVGV